MLCQTGNTKCHRCGLQADSQDPQSNGNLGRAENEDADSRSRSIRIGSFGQSVHVIPEAGTMAHRVI
jgi:hypothetical protein